MLRIFLREFLYALGFGALVVVSAFALAGAMKWLGIE